MEKTITIGGKDVRFNNNLGWAIVYRDQFNRDIIPSLMPLMAAAFDVISGIIKETGKTENIELEDLLGVIDGDTFLDAIVHVSSVELVDFINIAWAMAKWADDSIPEPKKWIKDLDFTLDEVAPELIKLLVSGVVSSKNLERLRGEVSKLKAKKPTQPSNLILLSSPDSSEA